MNTNTRNDHHPATIPMPIVGAPPPPAVAAVDEGGQFHARVHPRTIWRWFAEGVFPKPLCFGTGDKSRRWLREDIERIAREGMQPPPE
jgi:hypothetical protein